MSPVEFLCYIYQYEIKDAVLEDQVIDGHNEKVLTNGEDSVIVTNFNFAPLIKSPKFLNDLSAGMINSTIIIKIVKAYILGLSRYNKQVLEYHYRNNANEILDKYFLEDLCRNHLYMCQSYTYLNEQFQHICDNLKNVIDEPQTINDDTLREAYLKILQDYENETSAMKNTLHRNIPNMYDDDQNELGFISIASIILIIINLGIIIATFIYRH